MLGNILVGGYIEGDKLLGVNVAEVTANISKCTSGVKFRSIAAFSSYPAKPRIPELDIVVDFKANEERIVPGIAIGAYGNFDEFGAEIQGRVGFGSYSTFIPSIYLGGGDVRVGFGVSVNFIIEHPNENSIAWSKIGELDFTIGEDNVAGNMPIDWKGYVYAIEQLGRSNNMYVYGANGITKITPHGLSYGRKQIYSIGIKSKHAIVNTGVNHYFIDENGEMFKIAVDGDIKKLGYGEYLEQLDEVVMSFDKVNKFVYICDGVLGFVYSEDSDSLTSGPVNVTGVDYQDGVMYVAAPVNIAIPEFSLITDTYNMGTNKEKTIRKVKVVANDYTGLQLAIDYRVHPGGDFTTTPYLNVSPDGIVSLPCYGREFRFRILGTNTASDFKIESITIDGQIHDYNYFDTITIRDDYAN